MGKYKFNDLPNTFEFLYDTGENYLFKCYKEEVLDINSCQNFFIESATGQGIWEDNSYSLRKYLEGKVDPLLGEDNCDDAFSLPWNFENKCFKDFDNEVNIEEFKEDYSKHFSYILSRLRKEEIAYITYYKLPLKDIEPDYKFIRQLKKLNKI